MESCVLHFPEVKGKESSFYAICCCSPALASAMGGGRSGRLCGAAGSSGAACAGQRLLFPAAQSLGQRGAFCSGPLRSPCGRCRAGLLPQSRRLRHLGCGCRLFLLDIIEPELCIRLGLRQLPAQAVRRRSRLSAPWPTTTPISSPSSPSSPSASRATPATPIPSVRCSASCPPCWCCWRASSSRSGRS